MVNPVSTELYTGAPATAHTAEVAQNTAPTQATETQAPAGKDHVTLSAGAQAQLLEQQGQSVAQIAVSLGLSASTVDSYLGIQASSPAVSQPVAAAAVLHTKLA